MIISDLVLFKLLIKNDKMESVQCGHNNDTSFDVQRAMKSCKSKPLGYIILKLHLTHNCYNNKCISAKNDCLAKSDSLLQKMTPFSLHFLQQKMTPLLKL